MAKLLELIPKELHEDLFAEVQEVLKQREQDEKKEAEKKLKTEVSPLMKDFITDKQKSKN